MSYWYKFSAWFVEMPVEALLLSRVAIVMSQAGFPTARDIAALTVAALTSFGISGYLITTLAMRLFLGEQWLYLYPIIAPILFLAHFEVLNLLVPEGLLDIHNRFIFRVISFVVVLFVAASISFLLKRTRRWTTSKIEKT